MSFALELEQFLLSEGCAEVGFFRLNGHAAGTPLQDYANSEKLHFGISVAVRLSDAVIDGILGEPTHVYFHHYRTVNALIDRILLRAGILIGQQGYRYLPVAASQSVGEYCGLFPHKTAARLSGLGSIGKNGLFLSRRFGCRVRLGTILTDMPLPAGEPCTEDLCGSCGICAAVCPAMAIYGKPFSQDAPHDVLDRRACSEYMKKHFQHIGRGAVCGLCMKNCPYSFDKR